MAATSLSGSNLNGANKHTAQRTSALRSLHTRRRHMALCTDDPAASSAAETPDTRFVSWAARSTRRAAPTTPQTPRPSRFGTCRARVNAALRVQTCAFERISHVERFRRRAAGADQGKRSGGEQLALRPRDYNSTDNMLTHAIRTCCLSHI